MKRMKHDVTQVTLIRIQLKINPCRFKHGQTRPIHETTTKCNTLKKEISETENCLQCLEYLQGIHFPNIAVTILEELFFTV